MFRRRDRLVAAAGAVLGPGPLTAPDASRLAGALLRALPPRCRADAVYRAVAPLVGTAVDPATLRTLAWALAGNVPALRAGALPYPPRLPAGPARVTVQVLAAKRLPGRGGADAAAKFRVRYRLLVLAGPGCPGRVDVTWSSAYAAYFAGHPAGLGFAGRRPPRPGRRPGRPYQHYSTLVGLRFSVELAAADGRHTATRARCTAGQRAHARALTEMRWRATFACPFAYTHPCHRCPKGQTSCPAAVRPEDLVDRPCPACGATAPTDPYWGDRTCVGCARRGRPADSPAPRGPHA